MRSQFSKRLRSASLSAIPPPQSSTEYSPRFADIAAHILYRSPLPSQADLPVFILNAAAFPDVRVIDYSVLLPYVLARLPDEDELIGGKGYEVVFFAGGEDGGATATMKGRPGWSWLLQAYHLLTRATRKRMQKLYLVHERKWIRVMVEMFSTIVSPKSRKKIVHGKHPPHSNSPGHCFLIYGFHANHLTLHSILHECSGIVYPNRGPFDTTICLSVRSPCFARNSCSLR